MILVNSTSYCNLALVRNLFTRKKILNTDQLNFKMTFRRILPLDEWFSKYKHYSFLWIQLTFKNIFLSIF